jgi:Mn2+/Fe2+ NRAMP family transporter
MEDVTVVAVAAHVSGQDAIGIESVPEDCRAGAVAKEDAGVTVLPIHDAAKLVGTDNKNCLTGVICNELAADLDAIEKARAGCSYVETGGIFCADLFLNMAGGRWKHSIRSDRANNNKIDFLWSDPCIIHSTPGSGSGHVTGEFGLSSDTASSLLIGSSAVLLFIGGYKWLDRFMKLVMPLLTISTFAATALALGRIDWSFSAFLPIGLLDDPAAILFMVALIGWMPSPIDISVWSSLWTVARAKQQHTSGNLRSALADFDAGYIITLVLGLAFVLMGTGLMYGSGITFENNAAKFAEQVIDLYTRTLGDWFRPLIGGTAFLVMLSTTVTVIDAFPRVLAALLEQLRIAFARTASDQTAAPGEGARIAYRVSFAILAAGSLAILAWGMSSFTALVDLATTLSFVTAPALSFFNHRAVFGDEIPSNLHPGNTMRLWSQGAIVLQTAFAMYFFWIKFAHPLLG